MKILHAALWGVAVWCLVVMSALPAAADEPASCYRSNNGLLLSNGNVVSKPGAIFDPIFKTHTIVPYPKLSQREGERGTATFLVSVGTDGTPTDVAVKQSGVSRRLNDAAIEHIKEHWRWPSPVTACGQNTAQALVMVMWQLAHPPGFPDAEFHVNMPLSAYPPGASDRLEDGSTLLLIETDGQGAVIGGRVFYTSGFSDLDDQALALVKNSPALLKGVAAGKHLVSADWKSPATYPNAETVIVTAWAVLP